MKNRGQLAFGVILILVGAWLIAQRQIPALRVGGDFHAMAVQPGGNRRAALAARRVVRGAGHGYPGGAGGRNRRHFLLPANVRGLRPPGRSCGLSLIGFIGVGQVLAGLLGSGRKEVAAGLNTIAVSALLFVLFAALFGRLTVLGEFGPAILLILLGLWVIARGLWRGRRKE